MAKKRFASIRGIYTFFPVQLLLLHLRRSFLLLIFWLLLFAMAGGWILLPLGIPYLFLTPEYLNEVSALAYFIMGFVLGFFVMAFHLASYIFYSYRYTFLATLRRPLYRFSINNSLLPILFYVFYGWKIYGALISDGHPIWLAILSIIMVVLGSVLSLSISFTYFFSITGKKTDDEENSATNPLQLFIKKEANMDNAPEDEYVYTYLRNFHTIRLVRSSSHYDDQKRLIILQQHHTHAAIYFIAILLVMFGLSWLGELPIFMLPAAASLVLMLTSYMMIFGALFSWLKTWTISALLVLLVLFNYVSKYPNFQQLNFAAGMNYEIDPAPYTYEHLQELTTDSIQQYDKEEMIRALEGWKKRQKSTKPKLIIINSSGGGLRSAMFTLGTLQYLDSLSNDEFMHSVFIVTGSSGGMIGASYYRELWHKHKQTDTIDEFSHNYYNTLGTDILNPVGFTMVMNDLFVSTRKFKAGGFVYPVDRGRAFDLRLSENTLGMLDMPVFHHLEAEQKGEMPLLVLSPTIINEGRRLLISPMGLSFLTLSENAHLANRNDNYDAIEYRRFFSRQQADSLSFITALRMSSTFPYITPLISLPSEPRIELIDAGARDNDGLLLTLRFLHTFRDWIAENTNGVMVVQLLAARPIEPEIRALPVATRLDALVKPIGGMFSSFASLQLFTRAEMLKYAEDWMDFPMDIVQFDLLTRKNEISLSWHLTEREKVQIYQAIRSNRLQDEYEKVLLGITPTPINTTHNSTK